MLTLEEKLKRAQDRCNKTPNVASKVFPAREKYFDLYCRAKDWLSENILKYGTVKVASDGDGFYPGHGIEHCESIIRRADMIFDKIEKRLTDYEVFLFLMSVLMHDAGMVHGRSGHGHNCRIVAKSMGNCLPRSMFEQNMIFKIAEAHQGKTIAGTSDTLGSLFTVTDIQGIPIRPALLAALLRFFDEISEDSSRGAAYLSKEGELPKESKIYHAYALCIESVSYENCAIKIIYYLPKDMLKNKFDLYHGGKVDSHYMFDWICSRLTKVNSERIYCGKFLWGFLKIEKILASVILVDDNLEEDKTISIQCIDSIDPGSTSKGSIVVDGGYTGTMLAAGV